MKLVELTYFPGEGSHRSPMLVNPDHVVFLFQADGGRDGDQCWMRLSSTDAATDFLVSGSFATLAAKLQGDPR